LYPENCEIIYIHWDSFGLILEITLLFGGVTGIALNRGFGFVQYEQESSAIEAIKQENGAVYRGKKMGGFCIKRNK
jgi:RNA recognition motif-containing protein